MRHVHNAQSRGKSPGCANQVVSHIGNRQNGVLTGELFNRNRKDIPGNKLIQRGAQPVDNLVKGPALIRNGGRGCRAGNFPADGIGGLDVVRHPFSDGFVILQAAHLRMKFRFRVFMRTVGNAGIHGFPNFLIDPRHRPVGRTGHDPAVAGSPFLKFSELVLELALLGIPLQVGKNGLINLIRSVIEGTGRNG